MTKLFVTKEHQSFTESEIDVIKAINLDFVCTKGEVKFLGLNPNMYTSYFIGIDWLKKGEYAIKVNPKIQNLDIMRMFLECLKTPYLNKELSNIYHIDLNKPHIEVNTKSFDITPMLIVHFVSVVKNLTSKGLKKDYIRREENLQSKVKGKIKFTQHFKYNISRNRLDKNYCNYQDYSVDCLENQLLKKTLMFAQSYIGRYCKKYKEALVAINYCMSAFENVSDDVDAIMIKKVRINPVFKEYADALKLAKMILRRFAYSISQTNKQDKDTTPPYWIDMSLLFEIYVYGKLHDAYGSTIKYQEKGKYGNTDFLKLDEKLIIDTKYKLIYNDERYEIENIRQISGYARDISIRKKLKAESNELLPCCIIYPNQNKAENFTSRKLCEEPIRQFVNIWKIGLKLPLLNILT